ncbi:MAG: DUF721 domain-containing protein [Nitrospira sp.]|nr:DUF721 domain-containing protein [Nitrospira sp.]
MRRADSLLQPFVRELGIDERVRLAGIKKNWRTLFNEPLSSHMSPCSLSGGELLIHVDSPVWLQELNYYKGTITERLSPLGVREVRFRLGRVSTKVGATGKAQREKGRQLTTEEHSYIKEVLSQIDDDSLRGTIKTAIEKAISSGRTKIR